MKLRHLYLFCLVLTSQLYAYEGDNPEFISRSSYAATPEVASLASYTDFPVSNYTGIPQIEIPIHEIKVGNFTLPVTLRYHAKGVQITEAASNVGLGWSLDAGGFITRAVRSEPDDYNKGLKIDTWDRPGELSPHYRVGRFWSGRYGYIDDLNEKTVDYNNLDDKIRFGMTHSAKLNWADPFYLDGSGPGLNDLEPDIFYINCGPVSGQFVFKVVTNTNNPDEPFLTPAPIPGQDIKISHTLDSDGWLSSFTIVDEHGNRYIFDVVERLYIDQETYGYSIQKLSDGSYEQYGWGKYTGKYNTYNCPMTWFLSKIITTENKTIVFTYEDEYYHDLAEGSLLAYPDNDRFANRFTASLTQTQSVVKKRLSKIVTPRETIDFTAGHTREDHQILNQAYFPERFKTAYVSGKEPKAITNIRVRNISEHTVKRFELGYSYFNSNKQDTYSPFFNSIFSYSVLQSYHKRLKLNTVKQEGTGTYTFTYNTTYSLPWRFSPNRDIWGFFNNASNEAGNQQTMLPSFYYYPKLKGNDRVSLFKYPKAKYESIYGTSDIVYYEKDNRLANPQSVSAGMLTKIQYPTGGSVNYEYESNTFLLNGEEIQGGGVRIKSIKKYDKGKTIPAMEKYYDYKDSNGNTSGKLISMPINVALRNPTKIGWPEPIYLYSSSPSALSTTQGGFVGYTQVTISDKENDTPNGKVVYQYSCPGSAEDTSDPDGPYQKPWVYALYYRTASGLIQESGYDRTPYPPNPIYDWARGLLLSEQYYDAGVNLLKEIIYSYQNYYNTGTYEVNGFKYEPFKFFDQNNGIMYSYLFSKYKEYTNASKVLSKKVDRIYSAELMTPSTITTEYKYGADTKRPTEEKVTMGSTVYTTYFNYGKFPITNGIGVKNYTITSLIESTTFVKEGSNASKISSSTAYEFDITNNTLLLVGQYSYPNNKKSIFQAYYDEYDNATVIDQYYRRDFLVSKFYMNKPVEVISKENIYTVYVWGYNNEYLVAEIKNLTYDQVKTVISDYARTEIANEIDIYQEEIALFNLLRSRFPDAEVTNYKYIPLFGVTSVTDPRGMSTYYNYDSYGRVTRIYIIENGQEKTIEKYDYNYVN